MAFLFVVAAVALSACSRSDLAGLSASPQPSPGHWAQVASATLAAGVHSARLLPPRLRSGHVRFVVSMDPQQGRGLQVHGFRGGGLPSPGFGTASAPPELVDWSFSANGGSQRTDLKPGRWGFLIVKPGRQVATVTLYELL